MTERLSVAVLVPSRVLSGQFKVRVLEYGMESLITVTWSKPLSNLKFLHTKWLTSNGFDYIESYHPKLAGFEYFLKACRLQFNDSLGSVARISIPF